MGKLSYSKLEALLNENIEEKRAIEVMNFQRYPQDGNGYDYYARIAARACAKRDLRIFLRRVDKLATLGKRKVSPVNLRLIIDFNWNVNGFVSFKAIQNDIDFGTMHTGFKIEPDSFMKSMINTIFDSIAKTAYLETINEILGVDYTVRKEEHTLEMRSPSEYCWGIEYTEELMLYR